MSRSHLTTKRVFEGYHAVHCALHGTFLFPVDIYNREDCECPVPGDHCVKDTLTELKEAFSKVYVDDEFKFNR